ncbi:hypothetical protein BpHYR1_001691 [Brachionus plicatilis]|uniref:Uncharacterized protein n=1 Tax=Brachionus plicatilis TaxID=10195 RepID=A0A3M7SZS5_BRAPC|nr:hypothetical protein BpHYR1_001691 [Brachionus plicatilis]
MKQNAMMFHLENFLLFINLKGIKSNKKKERMAKVEGLKKHDMGSDDYPVLLKLKFEFDLYEKDIYNSKKLELNKAEWDKFRELLPKEVPNEIRNNLEKFNQFITETLIQTISLRKLQINQTSSPILDLFEKNQLIRNQLGDETTDIKLHYHNYKKRHSLSQMVNEELNYEIASSRTRLIDESSHSSLNDNVPVDTAESNLDSNSSCKLIESQSTINETVPKNKPSSTVEFDNDETNFMISKELNDESHLFTNAIKKACQIEDMIAKNVYYSIPQQENDLKNIISIIKANSDHLKTMNDDQIYDVIVNHIKKSESQTENGEDLPIIMKNLHSVKSLKNFFEVRAKSSDSEPHLNEEVKRIHSIEKSVNQGLGVCSDLEGDSKNDIIRESNAPVAPPLPEYLINREETKPKFSIKPRRSKTDSIYFYNQSNDLHDKLIREIHNKSLERSKKDTSLIFDEHGNLITKPMTQKNKTKLSKLKEINAPSTVSDKINQLGLNQTKITSFRYNKNRSQSADSKLHDRTIDMDMSNEIVDRQVQMIEMITGCKSSSHRLNDLNQNTTIRSDFSRISNSSVHSSRSMLSEAKAKLEAFGKYSKQARYESPKFDINDDLNDQILDSSIQMEPCVNEFLQTKF